MNAVLISIQPKWVEKIANGEKTIEVRKSAPKCEVPFKGYIYVTKGKPYLYRVDDDNNFELTNTLRPKVDVYVKDYNEQNGKVIGEFICDKVMYLTPLGLRGFEMREKILKLICLTNDDLNAYGGLKTLYGWHISDLKIYDKPKELSEFFKPCPTKEKGDCLSCDCLADNDYGGVCTNNLTRVPQSYMYVEEL